MALKKRKARVRATAWTRKSSTNTALGGHDVLDQLGEGGFAEGADSQAGESDTDLNAGNDAMEIAE